MTRFKVQTKIIFLLLILSAIFLSISYYYWHYKSDQEKILLSNKEHDLQILFDNVVQLKTIPFEKHVYFEYSLWDEMVAFVSTGNQKWATPQIGSALETYTFHAVWIYDTSFRLKYSLNSLNDNTLHELPLDDGKLPKLFSKGYYSHFFIQTPHGLMEIFGATIHPTADTNRQTAIRGYYFAGHLWDHTFISNLEKLTDSRIQLRPISMDGIKEATPSVRETGMIKLTRDLLSWDRQPFMQIVVLSESPMIKLFHDASNRELVLYLVFTIGLILILSFFLIRWISTPLASLSGSLTAENPELIVPLLQDETEFGHIARLIKQFFTQKDTLIKEMNDRETAETALTRTNETLQAIFEAFPDSYFQMDSEGTILDIKVGHATDLFVPSKEVQGKQISEIFPQDTGEQFLSAIREVLHTQKIAGIEYWLSMPMDERAYEARLLPLQDNRVIAIIRDITDRKRLEVELKEMASIDELTKLHNRRGFFSLAEHLIKTARRLRQRIVVLFIDLDGLKHINDTFGHNEGDKALSTIAGTFKKTLRDSDIIARIGGDEFVVMGITQHESDENIISHRILAAINTINQTKLYPYTFSVSIGMSCYDPEDPVSIDELLQKADDLMYEEKNFKKKAL